MKWQCKPSMHEKGSMYANKSVREQNIEKKDWETMAMDTSHMSPENKTILEARTKGCYETKTFS